MFGILFVLLALSMPIAAALGLSSVAGFAMEGILESINLARRMISGVDSFLLLAVPLYLLAGELMNVTGISRRLFHLADCLVGHIKGGLAHVNVFSSVFLAGCTGAATADTAMTSKVLIPIMVGKNFTPGFASAVTVSSSLLAPLIPPSITLIIYGALTDTSIGDLFMAGIIPGLLTAFALSVLVYFISKWRGFPHRERRAPLPETFRAFTRSLAALFLPVLIIGGIRIGLATPTEIAAIAVIYCLILGLFLYRDLKLRDLWQLLPRMALQSGAILLIIAAAAPFVWLVTRAGVPQAIFKVLEPIGSPYLFLAGVAVLLFVIGMFMEAGATLIVITPIVAPAAVGLGVDKVHLGIIITYMIGIGTLTPPFGQMVFISSAVSGIEAAEIFKELWPFILVLLTCAVLLIFLPQLSLWLPNIISGH